MMKKFVKTRWVWNEWTLTHAAVECHKRKGLFCIVLFCLMACEILPDTIPVTSVTISHPTAEMIEGETVQLKATVQPDNSTDKAVQWASSKQSVATVSENGLVTAIAEGTSTITATAGGKTGSCQVTVSKKVIAVTSITLNKEELNLVEGDQETLVATVMPENATDKTIEWATSSPDIAMVDGGKVTALKDGEATITAIAGDQSATCKVVVSKMVIAVESIELNKTSVELIEGDSDILVATVLPDNATDKSVTWITSDESIVTVDDSGKIKAIEEGKATVAAKAGEKTATCAVTVSKRVISVESITLDKTTLVMPEDESIVITATIKPDNATNKTILWSTSDASIATVFDGRVTSKIEGKAIITAKAGDKTAMCEVTVKKRIIDVASITLNKSTLSLVKGEEQTLVATVKPDNATDKTVTWSSSDGQIAKVDNAGRVTALRSGTATITAKAGDKTATCVVTVSTPIESITLDRTSMTLEEGQVTVLVAIISPSDADDKTVTWNTSASRIARVDQDGTVSAAKDGTAIITAKAGDKTATCNVTVKRKVIQVSSITLNKTNLSLEKGKTETLVATVAPNDATDKTVNWSSSDATIVSVDANGKVTALKGGQAVITAKAGEKSANCAVTVSVPVTGLALNEYSMTLTKGQIITLTSTVVPNDATDDNVTWVSSDRNVATVNQNGKVTAVSGGSATITAACGGITAECTVTVTVPVTSITLSKTSVALTKGETSTITATVNPSDATDKTVTWTSSDESVVTVSAGKITAVKSGTATIVAIAGGQTASCSVSVTTPVTSITLDRTSISLEEGQSTTLSTTVYPSDVDDKTVTWSSSSASVATVDNNGKVTAIREGTATITAQAGEKTATCTVYVQKKIIPVTSITLNKTSLSLEKGSSETLSATVKPDNATYTIVNWSSSDATVAMVTAAGKVTALKGGQAVITAKAGEQSATCVVTVLVPVTGLTLSQQSLTLTKGQTVTLNATVTPSDATDKNVTWVTSNKNIATVDQNGNVVAKAGGSATITAACSGFTAECTITVVVPVTSITLNNSSLALTKGTTVTLTATINPSDATDKTVTWSSSNESVATVSSGTVTAKKSGTATITAKAGDKTATCAVTVTTPVTSITLDKSSISLVEEQYATLTATVSPNDADDKPVTWSSSSTAIATVDNNGKVTAVKEGTATITAKAGNKTATCTVTVQKKAIPVTSVSLNKTTLSLEKGKTETLSATVAPNNATDKTVTWSSSDASVATVEAGTVTAKKSGTTIITASAGGQTTTCTVTVSTPVISISLDKTTLSIEEGQSANLVATVSPTDADDKTVTWSSSNQNIATVDKNGTVVAKAGGMATITAACGGLSADCSVTVIIPVTSITLNKTSLTMEKGQAETLSTTIKPDNATNKTVTWSSSNQSVATVDQNGKVVAKAGGTTKITASCGGFSAECNVTVSVPGTGNITVGEESFGDDMTIIINH